jgi:hypothetical protein
MPAEADDDAANVTRFERPRRDDHSASRDD